MSVVVVEIVSDSLLWSRPRVVSSCLLRAAEAARCFAACDLRPRWLSPPPLPRAGGAAGYFAFAARAVAAAVSAATSAAGGSFPGGALAPAAEPAAGGADDDASAARVVTFMAATPSPNSTKWIFSAVLRAGGAGVGAGAGGAARPAACIILSITAFRNWAASGV